MRGLVGLALCPCRSKRVPSHTLRLRLLDLTLKLLLAPRRISAHHVPRLVPHVVRVTHVGSYGRQSPAQTRPGLGKPEAVALVLSSFAEVAAGTHIRMT